MRIGLFFGSFNPVHTGHLIIASHIVNFFTDKVWFVVSPQNPFKDISDLLDVENRIALVEAAIQNNSEFAVSDAELKLPLPSFTIDTVNYLKKNNPEHAYYIIMGSDNFLNISKWKSADILLRDYKILVYERPGYKIENTNSSVITLNAPLINISSTEIRSLIQSKKSIRYIVPEAVRKIIEEKNFYA